MKLALVARGSQDAGFTQPLRETFALQSTLVRVQECARRRAEGKRRNIHKYYLAPFDREILLIVVEV